MSPLEVLQIFPSQRKDFLSALGVNDDNSSSVIKFETVGLQPRFPYYVSLLIHVECLNMTVKCTVIDEGAAASMMSQLNVAYHVRDPTLLQRFLHVRFLERQFDNITYIHVPRIYNQVADSYANVLDWHLFHRQ